MICDFIFGLNFLFIADDKSCVKVAIPHSFGGYVLRKQIFEMAGVGLSSSFISFILVEILIVYKFLLGEGFYMMVIILYYEKWGDGFGFGGDFFSLAFDSGSGLFWDR